MDWLGCYFIILLQNNIDWLDYTCKEYSQFHLIGIWLIGLQEVIIWQAIVMTGK